MQLLQGDVHDYGAAMFGGVAGHAGLFSNAYDLAQLYQMILNKGELNGKRFLKKKQSKNLLRIIQILVEEGWGLISRKKIMQLVKTLIQH